MRVFKWGGEHLKSSSPISFQKQLSFFLILFFGISNGGCSIIATRPTQEMSDTTAALRAAREVQADTLAPELFRLSGEWFIRAKREYKLKNFQLAKEYAGKARRFAEQAEFEALRNGGNRTDMGAADPLANAANTQNHNPSAAPTPYEYPSPTGTPASEYDERKAAEDAAKAKSNSSPQTPPATSNVGQPNPTPQK